MNLLNTNASTIRLRARENLKGHFFKTWNLVLLCMLLPYSIFLIAQIYNLTPIIEMKYDISSNELLAWIERSFSLDGNPNDYMLARYWISQLDTFITLMYVGAVVFIIFRGACLYGCYNIYLKTSRGLKCDGKNAVEGFKFFIKALGLIIWQSIFITLWTYLLIIPGIIASLRYSMAFFIMIDNPELGIRECVNRSKDMMRDKLWKYFCIQLSFAGWYLALFAVGSASVGVLYAFLKNVRADVTVSLLDGFVFFLMTLVIYVLAAGIETYRGTTNANVYRILTEEENSSNIELNQL